MSEVKSGQTVQVHYVGSFDDGTEFDNSRKRGAALTVEVGSGQTISGFDQALIGMSEGEVKTVSISPEEGYGAVIPEAIQEIPLDMFPQGAEVSIGSTVTGTNAQGQELVAKVTNISDDKATLDMNHPLAGKNLNFEIELISLG